jgi:hypothetical protein
VFEVQLSSTTMVVRWSDNSVTTRRCVRFEDPRSAQSRIYLGVRAIASLQLQCRRLRVKMNQRVHARPASTVRIRHRVAAHAAKAGDAAVAPQRNQQVSDLPGTSFYSLELELREAMDVQA